MTKPNYRIFFAPDGTPRMCIRMNKREETAHYIIYSTLWFKWSAYVGWYLF